MFPALRPGLQSKRVSDCPGPAKIGVGMTLDEIMLANTPASFEPALDYVVVKLPRFPLTNSRTPTIRFPRR